VEHDERSRDKEREIARRRAIQKEIEREDELAGATNPGRLRSAPLAVPECNKIFEDLLLLSGSAETGLINIYDVRLYDTTAGDVWPPSQYTMKQYLNSAKVRKAIHAVELFEWNECSGPVNMALGKDNMIAARPKIAEMMDRFDVPVLIYNGQFDLICNHVGTEAYLSTMRIYKDLEKFLASRRAVWNVDGEIAGYVKHAKGTKLTFLLVLGGSHMCPMDKPKQTHDMINRFMSGKDFNDEETMVDLPFTPTVPYIPGDVVNASRKPHYDPYHAEDIRVPPKHFLDDADTTTRASVLRRENIAPEDAIPVPMPESAFNVKNIESETLSTTLFAIFCFVCGSYLVGYMYFRRKTTEHDYDQLP